MKPIIAVLCPMTIEFDAVENFLGVLGEPMDSGFEEKHYSLVNADLILARCGVGKTFAAAKAQKVIMTYHPAHLFVCGVAGAVDPALQVFDVVIPDTVVHGDVRFGETLCLTGVTSSALPLYEDKPAFTSQGYRADRRHSLYKGGVLATLDSFAEEKEKEFLEKECRAVCIDMESASVAQISTLWGVPFTVIRAISDNRDHSFGDFEKNAPKACDAAARVLVEMIQDF